MNLKKECRPICRSPPGAGRCRAMPRQSGWRRMRTLFRGRMARCCAPPQGTRQAGRWQTAAHWLCRGLRIATGARPPRLTRGACRRIIVSPPQVVARQPAGAAFGADGIALRHVLHGASWGRHCWLCRTRRVPAHPPASLAGAGTYLPCWV